MAKTLGDITQELNEKVLGPARAEADTLLRSAREHADAIVTQAEAAAEKIRAAARQDAEKVTRQMQVDMDMAARNFLIMVQERLEAAVVAPVVEGEVRAALDDAGFLKRMIEILLGEFLKGGGREQPLEVLLPEKDKADLEAWFMEKFRDRRPAHWRCGSPTRSASVSAWALRESARFNLQLRPRGGLFHLLLAAFPQAFLRPGGVLGGHERLLLPSCACSHPCRRPWGRRCG